MQLYSIINPGLGDCGLRRRSTATRRRPKRVVDHSCWRCLSIIPYAAPSWPAVALSV